MAVSFEKNALVLRFETSTPEFAHKMIYAGLLDALSSKAWVNGGEMTKRDDYNYLFELLKEWQIAKPE
ncbi:hypothetical protein [Pinibacter aurantiacus]|uniref:Uncharacterized protein n=1 Tax=Pinibacter aurantiacus TaxID=2851599 RepID=A0A9E2W2I6_9BACT|nr:hypothetical protein [Pinibacter aurantiacus]MBV4357375.1 hypothetical protein [Pinibacter aurantiacus]